MGKIVTFYSYKGGTGRSMALANTAWILASRKKRVLAIDWDLEAPGLHRYFAPFLVDRYLTATKGVIEFVRAFAIRSATPPSDEPLKPDWFVPIADIVDYAVSARWNYFAPGTLDLIAAGQQDSSYATRVNSFDWDDFYEKRGGGVFLEKTKELMRSQYDYILIDSRTGVSDTSGICTVHLPDAVVVCFTLNNQSIEGASSVAQSIAAQRTDELGKSRIPIFPVPMRTDTFEKKKLDKRRACGREKFKAFLDRLPSDYWKDVEVPYWGYYGYEEVLATFGDEPNTASNSMLSSFENLTRHLTNGDVTSLAPPPPEERQSVLRFFEDGPPRVDETSTVVVVSAPASKPWLFDYYLSSNALESADAALLRQLLEARANSDFVSTDAILSDPNRAAAFSTALSHSSAFLFCEGRFGWSPWQLRELAFAFEHQKQEAERGREFPIIPVVFPAASTTSYSWLEPNVVDLRRKIDDVDKLTGLTRRLGSGEIRSFPLGANPFKGALPYQEIDEPVFLGRDADLQALAALLPVNPIVFLRGASGVGKTSLVNAGLKPLLRRQSNPSWEIASFTPQTRPFSDLAAALVNLWSTETNETNRLLEVSNMSTALASGSVEWQSILQLAFRGSSTDQRLLIVVDQAELLLNPGLDSDRLPFLRLLGKFAEALPVTVLFLIRPEAEAPFESLMPAWTWAVQDGLVLQDMNAEAWMQIAGVRSRFGAAPVDATLVAQAVDAADRETKPAGKTAVMSSWLAGDDHTTETTFVDRSRMALDLYLAALADADRAILLSTLVRLIDVSQLSTDNFTPSPLYWHELDDELRARFQPLIDRRILSTYLDPGRSRALVKLTSLAGCLPSLISFINANVEFLRWRQKISVQAILWDYADRRDELLLSKQELAAADAFRPLKDQNDLFPHRQKELTAVELALLRQSSDYYLREELRFEQASVDYSGMTSLIRRPTSTAAPQAPTAAPKPPAPAPPGEFTRMFGEASQSAPARPASTGATGLFQTAPQSTDTPLASAPPGEFTRMSGGRAPDSPVPTPGQDRQTAASPRRWLVNVAAAVLILVAVGFGIFKLAPLALTHKASKPIGPGNLNLAELNTSNVDMAIGYFTEMIQSGDTTAYAMRAYANRLAGNLNPALADYEASLKIHPGDVQSLTGAAYVYSLKKDYPAAVQSLTAAINADPANSRHYIDRANAYSAMGDNKDALSDWSAALNLDPTSPLAQAGRIRTLRVLGIKLGPADVVPTVYFQLASELQRPQAQKIHDGLRDLGYVLPDLEIVGNQPGSPELRFHNPNEQARAERLARDLKSLHFEVTIRNTSALKTSAMAQPMSFELWFGTLINKDTK